MHKQQIEQTLSPNEFGIRVGKVGKEMHILLSKYAMGENLVNY